MAGKRHIDNLPVDHIAAEFSVHAGKNISVSTVCQYLQIFLPARRKLLELVNLKHANIRETVEFINNFAGGVTAFAGYIFREFNLFIFGTPSQLKTV